MIKRVPSHKAGLMIYLVEIPEGRFYLIDHYDIVSSRLERTEIYNLDTKESVDPFLFGKINQLVNDFYHGKGHYKNRKPSYFF